MKTDNEQAIAAGMRAGAKALHCMADDNSPGALEALRNLNQLEAQYAAAWALGLVKQAAVKAYRGSEKKAAKEMRRYAQDIDADIVLTLVALIAKESADG